MEHKNSHLRRALIKKDDDWPTPAWMVERIFNRATTEFKDMSVYCPCDDTNSEFTRYFIRNFYRLGLCELVCTNYAPGNRGTLIKYDREGYSENLLDGDGDFQSEECCLLRDGADIVITNPPWSLGHKFLAWVKDKDYIIIGSLMWVTYNELWDLKKFICIANNLRFPSKREGHNGPLGTIYSCIDIPHDHPTGAFATGMPSEGILVQGNIRLYNRACNIPVELPIGTRILAPISVISMQRLYDAGYKLIGPCVHPYGLNGEKYFSKIIIEKVSEPLDK